MTTSASSDAQRALFRLGNSFADAQALMTAVELDLFTTLHKSPATVGEIKEALGLDGRGLRDFLHILVALNLVQEDGGRFRNTAEADAFLVAGEPGYIGTFMLGAKISLYLVWGKLTQGLRTGRPQAGGSFEFLLNTPEMLHPYVEVLDGMTVPLVPAILDAVDWPAFRTVVDLGGMRGSLAVRLVETFPQLRVTVVDKPQLRPLFDQRVAEAGRSAEVSFLTGDFTVDDLPSADVVVLGHIINELDPEQRESLLRRVFAAVAPGGVVLIYDRILDDALTHFDNLVASVSTMLVTEAGSGFTFAELSRALDGAGFADVSSVPLDDKESLVIGHRPVA